MARAQGTTIQNNFIKGLITETTAMKFPADAATETFNCVFDETGRVTKRGGVDLESGYALYDVSGDVDEAIPACTEYLWQAVGGTGEITYTVYQRGKTLHFYDASDTVEELSTLKKSFTVDITDFLPTNPGGDPSTTPCSYASGNGVLIVCNRHTDPFYVKYDVATDTITTGRITIQYRDFVGLDDGLDVTERPAYDALTDMLAANPNHYYNLLNQGWHQGGTDTTNGALGQWETARTDFPSNADYVGLYRASATDSFDNARVLAQTPGNTPAPKGHFILDLGNADRSQAMSDEGFGSVEVEFGAGSGTIISSMTDSSFAFDTDFSEAYTGNVATFTQAITKSRNTDDPYSFYIGKTLTSAAKFVRAVVYPSNNRGLIHLTSAGTAYAAKVQVAVYGRSGLAPTSPTDGVLIGESTPAADGTSAITVYTTDSTNTYDHIWVTARETTSTYEGAWSETYYIAEVQFFINTSTASAITVTERTSERPSVNAFFAGRAWYSGMYDEKFSNSIYFSQIIEHEDQYGKCYQSNDPTSEDLFDLVQSDGGVIRIPECGIIKKLFSTQYALMVFATNGVWIVRGPSQGAPFTATGFAVQKLSSLGTQSGLSFVDVAGFPYWWGESGIMRVDYNPQYDSYSVQNLTETTIKTFFSDVHVLNRTYVKGAFDLENNIIYWLYNRTETLAEEDYYTYDSMVVFNLISSAFYPWEFGISTPQITGLHYCIDAIGFSDPVIKYSIYLPNSTDITFGKLRQDNWADWSRYATDLGTAADEIDIEAYFITGQALEGQGNKKFQVNYIEVFSDAIANSSCFVQSIYEFTNSPNTAKWGTKQQIYNDILTNRDVIHRKLQMRGHGKCLQLRFYSNENKPFSIIGWSSWITANQGV